jgi:hypothetical protein
MNTAEFIFSLGFIFCWLAAKQVFGAWEFGASLELGAWRFSSHE